MYPIIILVLQFWINSYIYATAVVDATFAAVADIWSSCLIFPRRLLTCFVFTFIIAVFVTAISSGDGS